MTKKPYTPPEAEDISLVFSQVLAASDPNADFAEFYISEYYYDDMGIE